MTKQKLPEIDIAVDYDGWSAFGEPDELINRAIGTTLEVVALAYPPNAELSIVLTDNASIRDLNKQWRNIDKATNVLSFPGSDVLPGEMAVPLLGDIVIAFETLNREALESGVSIQNHFIHLIIHGFLHLFGYDHIDDHDAKCMEQLERKALARLGIADPYEMVSE